MQKYFLLMAVFAVLFSCNNPENNANSNPKNLGLDTYTKNCTLCHGTDGKLNAMNAKDLSISTLSQEETEQAVVKGSPDKGMPAYGPRLSAEEMKALIDYVMQLRKQGN